MLKNILLLSLILYAKAFVPLKNINYNKINRNQVCDNFINNVKLRFSNDISRRDIVEKIAYTSSLSSLSLLSFPAYSFHNKKVLVFGASGYTGGDTIRELLKKGCDVVAVTRRKVKIVTRENAGADTLVIDNINDEKKIKSVIADVVKPETLNNIMNCVDCVIFCASSRPKVKITATPGTKDYDKFNNTDIVAEPSYNVEDIGLVNVAKEVIKNNVKKLIIVSSICAKCQIGKEDYGESIDRGFASCENCYKKQIGEERIRLLYENIAPDFSYTIIRPGMLSPGEKRGPKEIEFNQGVSKSGIISRMDLSDILVSAAYSNDVSKKTFEVYYKDTAQPVDMFKSLKTCKEMGKSVKECFFGEDYKNDNETISIDKMLKNPVKGVIFPSGNEVLGNNYNDMFKLLKKDIKNDDYDINILKSIDII